MKTPGVKDCATVVGYNLLSGVTNTYSTFFLPQPGGVGEAHNPRSSTTRSRTHFQWGCAGIPDAIGFAFPPPPSPASAPPGSHVHPQDRAGRYPFLTENRQKFMEAARKRPSCGRKHHVPAIGAQSSWTWTGTSAGSRASTSPTLQDAPGLPGKRLRQLLQPVRPPVAGLRPGGGDYAPSRSPSGILRAQQRSRRVPFGAQVRTQHRRAGVHHAVQLSGPPDQRLRRPGVSSAQA